MHSSATAARVVMKPLTTVTPRALTVEDVMSRAVISVRSTERLRAAAEVLLLHGVGGGPVELGGVVLGTVTLMDLNRALLPGSGPRPKRGSRRSLASGTVADVMEMDIVTVPVGTSLVDALAIMDAKSTDRVIVVNGSKSVGIVTATDIARGLALRGSRGPAIA